MASSTLYSFAFGPLHKSWVIIRFAVGSGFSFWIICDSSESSYSDIPARPSHVTSDHPRRLWTAAGEHFARCDEYVCSDASRPTSWGPCELDTGVTTWPTYMYLYVPHNRHINRWIITAACGCCYSSDDRLVGRQYSGSEDKSNSELESSPSPVESSVSCSHIWLYSDDVQLRYSTPSANFCLLCRFDCRSLFL